MKNPPKLITYADVSRIPRFLTKSTSTSSRLPYNPLESNNNFSTSGEPSTSFTVDRGDTLSSGQNWRKFVFFWGVSTQLQSDGIQLLGGCPFTDCGKIKFYMNSVNGLWDCKSCSRSGNGVTFLQQFHADCFDTTTAGDYEELRNERGLLTTNVLRKWGLALSPLTNEWCLPAYNIDGKLTNLYAYKYDQDKNKRRFLSSPNMSQQMLGVQFYDENKKCNHVLEGIWDGMIWDEILQSTKSTPQGYKCVRNEKYFNYKSYENNSFVNNSYENREEDYQFSSNKECETSDHATSNSKISGTISDGVNILVSPGAGIVNGKYVSLFKDKTTVFLYDNDYPKETYNERTGKSVIREGAGSVGMKKTFDCLIKSGIVKPSEIKYINWGNNCSGYDKNLPDKYDIRDHFKCFDTIEERVSKLSSIIQLIKPATTRVLSSGTTSTIPNLPKTNLSITNLLKTNLSTTNLPKTNLKDSTIVSVESVEDISTVKVVSSVKSVDSVSSVSLRSSNNSNNSNNSSKITKTWINKSQDMPPIPLSSRVNVVPVSDSNSYNNGTNNSVNNDVTNSVNHSTDNGTNSGLITGKNGVVLKNGFLKNGVHKPVKSSESRSIATRDNNADSTIRNNVSNNGSNNYNNEHFENGNDVTNKPKENVDKVEKLLEPIYCDSWEELIDAGRSAYVWDDTFSYTFGLMLGAVASTTCAGSNQCWICICSPPSSGKSSLVNAMATNKDRIKKVDRFTGMYSGMKAEGKKDLSLLAQCLGMTFIISDGDSILAMPEAEKRRALSELRTIHDGETETYFKTGAGNKYPIIKMSAIMCGTETLRELDKSELGSRYVTYIMKDKIEYDVEEKIGIKVIDRGCDEMDTQVTDDVNSTQSPEIIRFKQLTAGYIEYLRVNAGKLYPRIKYTSRDRHRLWRLAYFTSFMRTQCPPDKVSLDNVFREMPYRLSDQFQRFCKSLTVVMNKEGVDEEILWVITKLAMDTSKGSTLATTIKLYRMLSEGKVVTSATFAAKYGYEEKDADRRLKFLTRLGVAEDYNVKGVREKHYKLTNSFEKVYKEVME